MHVWYCSHLELLEGGDDEGGGGDQAEGEGDVGRALRRLAGNKTWKLQVKIIYLLQGYSIVVHTNDLSWEGGRGQ